MVFTLWNLIEATWIILPAYAANGFAPFSGGRRPIDGNKKFPDKRPLFGKGKTWEGFVIGIFIATIIGLVEYYAFPYLPFDQSPVTLTIVPMSAYLGFLLGLGAMLGDLAGSFIKRRFNVASGAPVPILDQDDFVVGALLMASIAVPVKLEWYVLLLTITPIFHLMANYIAFRIRIKRNPW
jgi:CDP-2,3-bis-(O-geranylgeranyl)-sn-glycerol synthase